MTGRATPSSPVLRAAALTSFPWGGHGIPLAVGASGGVCVRILLKFMCFASARLAISASTASSFGPQSFPASGSFPMSSLFTFGGQSIGASASADICRDLYIEVSFTKCH